MAAQHQNLGGAAKIVSKGKFIALNVNLTDEARYQIQLSQL